MTLKQKLIVLIIGLLVQMTTSPDVAKEIVSKFKCDDNMRESIIKSLLDQKVLIKEIVKELFKDYSPKQIELRASLESTGLTKVGTVNTDIEFGERITFLCSLNSRYHMVEILKLLRELGMQIFNPNPNIRQYPMLFVRNQSDIQLDDNIQKIKLTMDGQICNVDYKTFLDNQFKYAKQLEALHIIYYQLKSDGIYNLMSELIATINIESEEQIKKRFAQIYCDYLSYTEVPLLYQDKAYIMSLFRKDNLDILSEKIKGLVDSLSNYIINDGSMPDLSSFTVTEICFAIFYICDPSMEKINSNVNKVIKILLKRIFQLTTALNYYHCTLIFYNDFDFIVVNKDNLPTADEICRQDHQESIEFVESQLEYCKKDYISIFPAVILLVSEDKGNTDQLQECISKVKSNESICEELLIYIYKNTFNINQSIKKNLINLQIEKIVAKDKLKEESSESFMTSHQTSEVGNHQATSSQSQTSTNAQASTSTEGQQEDTSNFDVWKIGFIILALFVVAYAFLKFAL